MPSKEVSSSRIEVPRRILCAEDNTLLADGLIVLFSRAGYIVDRADDGQQAWEKMARDIGYYDVLLTDNQMPRLNGLALVRRVRTANFRGRIVVHCSGLSADEIDGYQALAVDWIVMKATQPEELLRGVEILTAA